jgi:hypothetical protein
MPFLLPAGPWGRQQHEATALSAALGAGAAGMCCVAFFRTYGYYGNSALEFPSGIPRDRRQTVARVVQLWVYPVKGMRGIQLPEATLRRSVHGGAGGFLYDRRFMVVNGEGNFVTQRQLPQLATVTTALETVDPGSWYGEKAKYLRLTAVGGLTVAVPCELSVRCVSFFLGLLLLLLLLLPRALCGVPPTLHPSHRGRSSTRAPWQEGATLRTVRCWSDEVSAEDCGDAAADFLRHALGRPDLRLVRFAAGSRPSSQSGDRRWTE